MEAKGTKVRVPGASLTVFSQTNSQEPLRILFRPNSPGMASNPQQETLGRLDSASSADRKLRLSEPGRGPGVPGLSLRSARGFRRS